MRVRTLMRAKPAQVDRTHPAIVVAARAYQQAFGAPAVFLRNGGTIPVVNLIQDALKIPVVLMGFGLPSDRIHGPNEKIHLPNFFKGVETSIRFLAEMGALQAASRGRGSSRLGSGKALFAKHEERV